MVRRQQRRPRVATQASVPAQPVGTLRNDERLLRANVHHVGAEQFLAVQPAVDQLVAQPGTEVLRPLCAPVAAYCRLSSRSPGVTANRRVLPRGCPACGLA